MTTKTFLFYDTETTGLAKMNRPCEDNCQPRVVQIAALVTDEDGNELAMLNEYIIPVGFLIPAEVVAVHGTTTEKATALGKNGYDVMQKFVKLAEGATVHVAHNIGFDRIVVRHECHKQALVMPEREEICTMLGMTKKCNFPGRFGRPKWPKLQEAYKWCFNKEFDKAHDAMADIRACKEVFFHSLYQRPKGEARTEDHFKPNPDWENATYEIHCVPSETIHIGPPPQEPPTVLDNRQVPINNPEYLQTR